MRRLVWFHAGSKRTMLVLSWSGWKLFTFTILHFWKHSNLEHFIVWFRGFNVICDIYIPLIYWKTGNQTSNYRWLVLQEMYYWNTGPSFHHFHHFWGRNSAPFTPPQLIHV
jgi:hypothetical protein